MRNLAQYPISREEISRLLTSLAEEFAAEQRLGDMRPLLLREAARIVSGGEIPTPVGAQKDRS